MLAGAPDALDDFEELMRSYGIVGLQRTGRVALPKLGGNSGAGSADLVAESA
jgi:acetolactate synthase-1/3 small subunit